MDQYTQAYQHLPPYAPQQPADPLPPSHFPGEVPDHTTLAGAVDSAQWQHYGAVYPDAHLATRPSPPFSLSGPPHQPSFAAGTPASSRAGGAATPYGVANYGVQPYAGPSFRNGGGIGRLAHSGFVEPVEGVLYGSYSLEAPLPSMQAPAAGPSVHPAAFPPSIPSIPPSAFPSFAFSSHPAQTYPARPSYPTFPSTVLPPPPPAAAPPSIPFPSPPPPFPLQTRGFDRQYSLDPALTPGYAPASLHLNEMLADLSTVEPQVHVSGGPAPSSSFPHYPFPPPLPAAPPPIVPTPSSTDQRVFSLANPPNPTRNPSDPFVPARPASPSSSAKPAATVLLVAAHRKKLGITDSATGRWTYTTSSPDAAASSSSTSLLALHPGTRFVTTQPLASTSSRPAAPRGKPFASLSLTCTSAGCSKPNLGRLMLRGGVVDQKGGADVDKYVARFECTTCRPLVIGDGSRGKNKGKGKAAAVSPPLASGAVGPESQLEAYYEAMLSGAVDRHLGLDLAEVDDRPPPAPPGKVVTGFVPFITEDGAGGGGAGDEDGKKKGVKKRAARALKEAAKDGVLVCDVCRRDVGSGSLTLSSSSSAVDATAEVICAHCDDRYLRCSDCGGGGNGKGVGRWRAKELFLDGRKTCVLPHGKPPPVSQIDFDVRPADSIPPKDLDELLDACAAFFLRGAASTAALPELMEGVAPMARNFREAENLGVDLWSCVEAAIRQQDDESTAPTTRPYIALYWTRTPSQSKRDKPAPASTPGRSDKVLSGMIIAEHDLSHGTLHILTALPFAVGDTGAQLGSQLLHTLSVQAQGDLAVMSEERRKAGQGAWPQLKVAWTLRPVKRDSRLISRNTRKGWIILDEFLQKFPDVDSRSFPPTRKVWFGAEHAFGWATYACRLDVAEGGDAAPGLVAAT
ncbi:hypothetical protein JCM8097_002635 [Rhodosporidiobolus ruineniae]